MRSCSTASEALGASWLSGATTITMSGRTRRWATEHRHKRAGRSCKMEASHPARLCRWGSTNIKPADSRYDRRTSGGQVTGQKRRPATGPNPTDRGKPGISAT